MNKNNVGPTHQIVGDRIEVLPEPESLRDKFAGLAMQAFASNPNGTMEDDVRAAWRYADAMILAREAGQ